MYGSQFEEVDRISNLAIHLSSPWSTISCYHIVKYVDTINEISNLTSFSGGRISNFKFRTENVLKVLDKIKKSINRQKCKQVQLTIHGQNLDIYKKEIEENLQMRLYINDNYCSSTALGNNFLLKNISSGIFEYKENKIFRFLENENDLYPYLYVLINYKIVFIKVSSDDSCDKVYEVPLDCDFLLTIAYWVHGIKTLEQLFEFLSKSKSYNEGDNVEGGTYQKDNKCNDKADAAVYFLQKLLHNLLDLIKLQSSIHNVNKIIIGEYFNNNVFLNLFSKCVEKYSNNELNIYFMRENGFSTAMGTLLKEIADLEYNNNWLENYYLSTGLVMEDDTEERNVITSYLALDSTNATMVPFPLLKDPKDYNPFYVVLTSVKEREYWINVADESLKAMVQRKIKNDPDGKLSSNYVLYGKLFAEKAAHLKRHPQVYGSLTFVTIQHILQQIKKELGLFNSHYTTKLNETKTALNILEDCFKHFDGLSDNQRCIEIAKSLIAGNMFDWASKEIYELFSSDVLDFKKALNIVPERPWAIDHLDLWLKRTQEPPYKFAAIFPDNCGFDFILGIIPFTRELIKRGTKIVFCVNKEPVMNDITTYEVKNILEEVCLICPIISSAYKKNKIIIMKHSRCSPCLDLRFVNKEFAELSKEIDLLVIDGMGRTIHTNFNLDLQIDCIKVCSLKDKRIAKEVGNKEFAAVFNYTKATK